MSTRTSCQHVTLAKNAVAHVQRCLHCQCISIHLGPFTLRMDDAGVEALWAVLGEAALELRAQKLGDAAKSARGLA